MHDVAMPSTHRHPLREPMLWLVIGLPLAAVVAGLLTLWIAIRAGGSDAIPEPVRRTAQIQVRDLGTDEAARRANLAFLLQRETDGLRLLRLTGAPGAGALTLHLRHPTDATQDRSVTLLPQAGAWRLHAAIPSNHDWRLELVPANGAWRLVGRWPAGAATARLAPALAALPDAGHGG
jgi:hypothetical protein